MKVLNTSRYKGGNSTQGPFSGQSSGHSSQHWTEAYGTRAVHIERNCEHIHEHGYPGRQTMGTAQDLGHSTVPRTQLSTQGTAPVHSCGPRHRHRKTQQKRMLQLCLHSEDTV